MAGEIFVLMGTSLAVGFTHTLLGPDHYLPFIALARARKWSGLKTAVITVLCGVGHVLSSIALGFLGIALGIAVFKLQTIESLRGEIAAWFLIIFGFTYCIWGIHRAIRSHPHEHSHLHESQAHSHVHQHISEHPHINESNSARLTPIVLFIIFIFGPCEPLIPLIMYPAAKHNMLAVAVVASTFGAVTIVTMLALVLTSYYGLSKLSLGRAGRYSHALAGFALLLCGIAVKFLGL